MRLFFETQSSFAILRMIAFRYAPRTFADDRILCVLLCVKDKVAQFFFLRSQGVVVGNAEVVAEKLLPEGAVGFSRRAAPCGERTDRHKACNTRR